MGPQQLGDRALALDEDPGQDMLGAEVAVAEPFIWPLSSSAHRAHASPGLGQQGPSQLVKVDSERAQQWPGRAPVPSGSPTEAWSCRRHRLFMHRGQGV
jgi:hypothetical protein